MREQLLFNVLAEETYINVLLQLADFFIGEPVCVFNLTCINGKETLLLIHLKDVVLACLVFLVGDVVLFKTHTSLFLELTEGASKGCLVRPLSMPFREGPHLALSALD